MLADFGYGPAQKIPTRPPPTTRFRHENRPSTAAAIADAGASTAAAAAIAATIEAAAVAVAAVMATTNTITATTISITPAACVSTQLGAWLCT